MNEQMLRFVVQARDEASATLDKIGGSTGGLSKAFGALKVAAVGAAVAGLAIFIKGAGELEDAYNKIRVGTGATGKALDGLKGDFQEVVKGVPASFSDAGTAVADLNTRLGLTGKPLQEASTQFLNLSRITGTSVATNIKTATRVFGDWGIEAADQAGTMDALFRASQASGASFDQLSQSVVQFGAPMRNLGFSLEESTAMFAAFEKTGVNTNTVMAGLKIGVGTLAKAGEDVPTTFRRIVDQIEKVGPGTKATGLAIKLFGQRAGPDLADAIAGGKFNVDEMMKSISGGGDTINKAAKDTETWKDKLVMFKNDALMAVEPLMVAFTDALGFIAGHMGYIVPVLAGLTAGLVVYKVVTGYVALTTALAAANTTALGAAITFATAPLTLIVVAIMLVVAGLVLLYEKNETFRDFVQAAWTVIKDVFTAVVGWIVEKLKEFGAWVQDVWTRNEETRDKISAAWAVIWEAISTAAGWIKGKISEFISKLGDLWTKSEGLRDAISAAWDFIYTYGIKANITLIILAVQLGIDAFQKVWEAGQKVRDKLKDAWDNAKSDAATVWGKIADVIGDAKDKIVGYVNKIISAVNWVIGKLNDLADTNIGTIKSFSGGVSSNGGTGGTTGASSLPTSGVGLMDNGGTGDLVPGQGGMGDGSGASWGGITDWVRDLWDKYGIGDRLPSPTGGLFGNATGALYGLAKDAILGLLKKHGGGPGQAIIDWAKQQLGKPYLWGATGPDAYDCSGLIYRGYLANGQSIPRTGMWMAGRQVSAGDARPADVGFFYPNNSQGVKYGHVKMYAGNNQTIESGSGGVHMSSGILPGASEIRTYLAKGGYVSGPLSGYPVMLHGREVVHPLNTATERSAAGFGAGNVTVERGAVTVTITGADDSVSMGRVERAVDTALERLAREIQAR